MELPKTMKAFVRTGDAADGRGALRDVPAPEPRPGWVLMRVRAFGLNDAEQRVRTGVQRPDDLDVPVVLGLECAGEVIDDGGENFDDGARVVACGGGLGLRFDGTYAQYALVPHRQVKTVPERLAWSWAQLGAFPLTYLTAWGSLFECLQLQAGETLLVHGATCALGRAAMQLATAAGARVVATAGTTDEANALLEGQVAAAILDEGEALAGHAGTYDKVLDLMGPARLRDTLALARPGGAVCTADVRAGLAPLDGFDPIREIPNGVGLYAYDGNFPTQKVFDAMYAFMDGHGLEPLVEQAFAFEDLAAALARQDEGAPGKLVVTV